MSEENPQATICARKGCEREGLLRPCLRVWAPNKRGQPAQMVIDMPICDFHAKLLMGQPEEFMSDAGWQKVVAAFVSNGLVPPDRRLTEVEFISHVDPLLVKSRQYEPTARVLPPGSKYVRED